MTGQSKKSIFITGGTSGIGLALAEHYLKLGHFVAVSGRDLSKLPNSMNHYSNLHRYQLDVRDAEQVKQAVGDFSQRTQALDIVVANAGISVGRKSKIPDFVRAREVFETNINGVMNTMEASLPIFLEKKKGHFVSVASVAGLVGLPGTSAYCAAKAAVIKLTESWAIDLHQFGIEVSLVNPGFVDTPLTQKNDHPMPFMIKSSQAAEIIARGIQRRRFIITFPWPMRLVMLVLQFLPRGLYVKLMRINGFSYSRN